MTFRDNSLKRLVCICTLLHHCHWDRCGRSSGTFLTWQLSNCLRIIWCCSHVRRTGRGLLKKKKIEREREILWIYSMSDHDALVKGFRLQGGDTDPVLNLICSSSFSCWDFRYYFPFLGNPFFFSKTCYYHDIFSSETMWIKTNYLWAANHHTSMHQYRQIWLIVLIESGNAFCT